MAEHTVESMLAELAEMDDPKRRTVNEKHGDDHGVNLSALRALAKQIKTNQELAEALWDTDVTSAQLLALLICKPKAFTQDGLNSMLREARARKTFDWLINYVIKKSSHADTLRPIWMGEDDPVVASAGWALTNGMIAKRGDELDLSGLLDTIEAEMKDAPDLLQWEMNNCLAAIGIYHPELRDRTLAIGEHLEVLKDYPTPPNCTSPYAPTWINEIVSRQKQAATS